LLAVAAKLWLTSDIRIIPIFAPHDAFNFVEHAKTILQGDWFGPYNVYTLIKQPSYPIYLATVQELGLPLPLANQLLYAFACVVACSAIRPIVRNSLPLAGAFIALLFNPFTYAAYAWVAYRSQLNASLVLLSVACAIGVLIRRRATPPVLLPWSLGLGFSFAAFWLTREESLWLVPCILVIVAAQALYSWRERRAALVFALPAIGLLSIWFVSIETVKVINGLFYGWYVTAERVAGEYTAGYNALARIAVPTSERHVPIPRAAREIAYSVSPAARELKPSFEGDNGRNWIAESCKADRVCDDIGGGWIEWAFRDAVSNAGHYTSASNARQFYLRLAHELDAACDAGTIRCDPKRLTVLPPVHFADAPTLFETFLRGVRIVGSFSNFSIVSWAWPGQHYPGALQADYAFVVRSITVGDLQRINADYQAKATFLGAVGKIYQEVIPYWLVVVCLLIAFDVSRRLRRRSAFMPAHVILFAGALLSAAVLIGGLAIIDALLGPVLSSPEYTSSVVPLLLFSLCFTTAADGSIARRLIRRRLSAGGA
jgi:hypothetical protein